jgi:excinuclease ABC subunit C
MTCIEVFFFRTGQNWGNRAYFPRADKSLGPAEVLGAFVAQFYDDKPPPRLIMLSHAIEEQALLGEALTARAGHKVAVSVPARGEKRDVMDQALANAREALERELALTTSQANLLAGLAERFSLPEAPRRIEVFDNSHIMGTNAVGAMIVAGAEGFAKSQYRKFNIRSQSLTPGDDYAMMREVLSRRFGRLMREVGPRTAEAPEEGGMGPWPDVVLIDGGRGQLAVACETFAEIGIADLPVIGIAKGPDRDAGRESFYLPGREPFMLPPRDPVLYFVQRLRDEAHRFAIGSHRARRKGDIARNPLDEIAGIGPARKRALLSHFGTAKAVSRADFEDLRAVPGISDEIARLVYGHFHERAPD